MDRAKVRSGMQYKARNIKSASPESSDGWTFGIMKGGRQESRKRSERGFKRVAHRITFINVEC